MSTEAIDYNKVVLDLRSRQARLLQELKGLEAAIKAMEPLANQGGAAPAQNASMGVSRHAFSGLKPSAAIVRYLGSVHRKQTKEIMEALKQGDVDSSSENLYSIVYTALKRLKADGTVVRDDKGWGLADRDSA